MSTHSVFTGALFLGITSCVTLGAVTPPSTEPTNSQESATKKSMIDPQIEQKYKEMVATLSPERQAWEKTLQENLGSFYLPIHEKWYVGGRADSWIFVEDDPKLPRVLLIGDSVSNGYTVPARKDLAGKANVHRAPANCGPTTLGLQKLDVWLGDGKWDVIHFNFGIHDHKAPVDQYAQRLETIVDRLEKTGATLVWASTTPIQDDPEKGDTGQSIIDMNAAAAKIMETHHIAIDDLYSFIKPHQSDYQSVHNVHFSTSGYEALGQHVAQSIESALSTKADAKSAPTTLPSP